MLYELHGVFVCFYISLFLCVSDVDGVYDKNPYISPMPFDITRSTSFLRFCPIFIYNFFIFFFFLSLFFFNRYTRPRLWFCFYRGLYECGGSTDAIFFPVHLLKRKVPPISFISFLFDSFNEKKIKEKMFTAPNSQI